MVDLFDPILAIRTNLYTLQDLATYELRFHNAECIIVR